MGRYNHSLWERVALVLLATMLLSITACGGSSGEKTEEGEISNHKPLANAGIDLLAEVDSVVSLSGISSQDEDGDDLSYAWTFISNPDDSNVTLSDSSTSTPYFSTDTAGEYIVQLVVNDGKENSVADTVVITVSKSVQGNYAPIANAGKDQSVKVDTTVSLSGIKSKDPDGSAITYEWGFLSKPIDSNSTLSQSTTSTPVFLADKTGVYMIQLKVNDGLLDSTLDSVQITVTETNTVNHAPTANAGIDQSTNIGSTVYLSGFGSQDIDQDLMSYSWVLTSKPNNSSAILFKGNTAQPSFQADKAGEYIIQLIVGDGTLSSLIDSVKVTVSEEVVLNHVPIADAGADQSIIIGETVNLTGLSSQDIDNNTLSYIWLFSSQPLSSSSILSQAETSTPNFVADVVGEYIIQLIVNDGFVNSVADSITVNVSETVNQLPTADAGSDQTVSSSNISDPSLGTNLSSVVDWTSDHPFVDLFKYSREWITACNAGEQANCTDMNSWNTNESALLDLDQNGWLRSLPSPSDSPVYWYVRTFWAIDPHYSGGRHIVLYDGEGTLEYGFGITKIEGESSTGRDVVEIDASQSAMLLTLTTTDPNNTGNYLRNIRMVKEGHESINLSTNPFNSAFLASLSHNHLIRFMDWMETNNSPQTTWSNRSNVTDARYTSDHGVPIELQLQLANALSVTAWVTIPHQVDDNYITQFANLALQMLDSNLDIYVEYTNEAWNSGFEQSIYMENQGQAAWPASTDSSFTKGVNWFGQRTAEMCDLWKAAWGGQSNRVHCVMGGFAAVSWQGEQALTCPLSDKSPCVDHGIDSLAIAPYFGGELGWSDREAAVSSWTLNELFAELDSVSIPEALSWVDNNKVTTDQLGIKLTAYEGGQHLVGVNAVIDNDNISNLFMSANRDSRMQQSYDTYLSGWKQRGGDVFASFNHIGGYSKWGSWGAKEYLSESITPKMQALVNYATANPSSSSNVTLQGSGADTDGSIVSYLWEQISGNSVVLVNSGSNRASFNMPTVTANSTLTFQLTVTDNLGGTAIDTKDVLVTP